MLRRELLSGLAATAAWGASGAASALAAPEFWDVLVVGSGAAGLCAGVAALEAGARRVLLLEKRPWAGGHAIVSSGSLNALSDAFGDSAERFFRDTYEAGGRVADEKLVRTMVEESAQLLVWLRGMGVAFEARPYEAYNGLYPRAWRTGDPYPAYRYISALMQRYRRLGGQVLWNARATALTAESGRIVGVELFGRTLRAGATVLATGGWGADVALRRRWRPALGEAYGTTFSPLRIEEDPATGDGIRMAEAAGARLREMDAVMAIPYWGGRVLDYPGAEIFLDDQGRRFTDETSSWQEIFDDLAATGSASFWVVTDERSKKGDTFVGKVAAGVVKSAPDIKSLARAMGVHEAVLEQTLRAYNRAAQGAPDEQFGRTRFAQPLSTPPYYFGRERFDVHYCCGGIAIDEHARVLGDAGPIAGLYAAGETTGGVHGRFRLGGSGLTDAMVFGRRAGRQAALSQGRFA